MSSGTHANLSRTCEVIEIPSGTVSTLAEGTPVRIMQSRGDSYTVWTDYGQMYRIDGKDADAIGQQAPAEKAAGSRGHSRVQRANGLGHFEDRL